MTDRSGLIVIVGATALARATAAQALAASRGAEVVELADDLEPRFVLEALVSGDASVVSIGLGALGSATVRERLRDRLVVWVDVDVGPAIADQTILRGVADIFIEDSHVDGIVAALDAVVGVPRGVRTLWATGERGDYPVYIGPGLLGDDPPAGDDRSGFWPADVTGRRFLVTDIEAGRRFGARVGRLDGGLTITPGEQAKSIANAEVIWAELARAAMTRADVVVALGGGVVGDLAGFCAATYQRGMRWVQVPTTLVAQVDSAYGGKTGVDIPAAKNYVGAFHQPAAVIADTDALATLPPAEIAAGYAEMIKTALLAGGWLWERVRAGEDLTDPVLISACAWVKLKIVAGDTFDHGPRQMLNLGHTVGHAIETATGYGTYRHGEAVGLGLLAALRLSAADDLRVEVKELLESHGLPTKIEGAAAEAVVAATALDKKRAVGSERVLFVLLEQPECPPRPAPGGPGRSSRRSRSSAEMVSGSVAASLNFRGIGDLPTVSGARTRPGLVFRSGTLAAVEIEELAALTDLSQVRLVIDLRSPGVRSTPWPRWASDLPEVRFRHCPLEERSSAPGHDRRITLPEAYLRLLCENGSQVRRALSLLATTLPRGATIVHCTLGKDRTGILTALLLALLGVERQEIIDDYARSDAKMPALIRRIHQADPRTSIGRSTLAGVYRAPPEAMRSFLAELDRGWGGAEGWALAQGVEASTIEGLRERLLEG